MKESVDIAELVRADIEKRAQLGEKKYGERLKPFNNRDGLVDAYEEALDLCMYLKQVIIENMKCSEDPVKNIVRR